MDRDNTNTLEQTLIDHGIAPSVLARKAGVRRYLVIDAIKGRSVPEPAFLKIKAALIDLGVDEKTLVSEKENIAEALMSLLKSERLRVARSHHLSPTHDENGSGKTALFLVAAAGVATFIRNCVGTTKDLIDINKSRKSKAKDTDQASTKED